MIFCDAIGALHTRLKLSAPILRMHAWPFGRDIMVTSECDAFAGRVLSALAKAGSIILSQLLVKYFRRTSTSTR
jgi:hypothetical protein